MSGVFISYRRADAQGWAGRLGEDLAQTFGDVARFFDLASIPPGADFIVEIERAIASADAVLVLIGPRWLGLRDEHNIRRLDDPNDIVATEVSLALTHQAPVIPVLLGGITMPGAAALPEKLRSLARRNAFELSDSRWEHDRDRLFTALEASTPLKGRPTATVIGDVSVGAGLQINNSEVGHITGVSGLIPAGGVGVLKGAAVTNTKMGDITGVEIMPAAAPEPKK